VVTAERAPGNRGELIAGGYFVSIALAMTLLVVNIELPTDFHPKTNQEFLDRHFSLSDTFTAYLITFFVLVSFWFGRAQETGGPEKASSAYAWATLLHLLSVTFLPFSMLAVSRYDVAGAVWVYGANMIMLAVTALAISRIGHRDSASASVDDGRVEPIDDQLTRLSAEVSNALFKWITEGTTQYQPTFGFRLKDMIEIGALECLAAFPTLKVPFHWWRQSNSLHDIYEYILPTDVRKAVGMKNLIHFLTQDWVDEQVIFATPRLQCTLGLKLLQRAQCLAPVRSIDAFTMMSEEGMAGSHAKADPVVAGRCRGDDTI
jgi:uncharacterized membrane protein